MSSTPRSRRRLIATALALGSVAVALVGCGPTGTSTSTGSSSALDDALKKGGELTFWSWTPQSKDQVALFEKTYPKVKVKLVNAGTGNDEYTKLQNVIKAGSGAPDVAQIEYFALPQFALGGGLADLTPYGVGKDRSKFTAGTWTHVAIGGKIFGLPQDSGPMAMFYNKKVFDAHGITVPTTWDDYIAAAKKIHAADPKVYIASDTGDAGFTTSMIWQAGGHPFATDGTKVTIDLGDAGATKWAAKWDELVQGHLLSPTPGFSDDWFKGLSNGTIATLLAGAWMPGILESSVADGAGDWRVAPMPTYDGTPVTAENGGSADSVLQQSKNPALATAFLRWMNTNDASVKSFNDDGGFPSTVAQLNAPAFTGFESKYFGGQKINEVLSKAASQVAPGWSYLPFQVYGNSIYGDTVGQSYANSSPLQDGLAAWQKQLIDYGNKQGFTVKS